MDPLAIAGLATGLIGGIGSLFGAGRASRRMAALQKRNPVYEENPLSQQRLGLAQTLLNARMPGAAAAERNIYNTQGSTLSNIQRNATSSADALALAGGVQAQTNQQFQNLGQQEAGDYYNRLENLTGAQQGVIGEQDKVFQDKVRRFDDEAAFAGADIQNRQNAWNSLSNLGFSAMNVGMAGGFGAGNVNTNTAYQPQDRNIRPTQVRNPLRNY